MSIEREKPIWQRQEGETVHSFRAFCVYRDLGEDRTHKRVIQALGKRDGYLTTVANWSAKNNWVKRCEAYDEYMDEVLRKTQEKELREMVKRQTKNAVALQEKGMKAIKYTHTLFIEPADALKMVIEGSKLERINRGEPTDINKVQVESWADVVKRAKEVSE